MTPSTQRQQFREALTALAARTKTKIPALNGRVEKACALVLQGDVELQGAKALVHSASDPTKTYTLEPGNCTCADFLRAPEFLCAHRLAAGFARKLTELLPQSTSVETEPGTVPLPEAPASVNVRAMLGGYEVQITLRGTDEAALLVRLAALLKRPDIRPVPKPAPRTGGWRKGS